MVTELSPTQPHKKRRRCIAGLLLKPHEFAPSNIIPSVEKLGFSKPTLAVLASAQHVLPKPSQKRFLELLVDTELLPAYLLVGDWRSALLMMTA